MCDPITLMIIGASVSAAMSTTMGVLDLTNRVSQQEDLNSSIEESYNAEITAARSKAILDQQNNAQQTQTEYLKNQQEQLQANREAMETSASAEAAASALNVAGNTAQRAAAVTDVNTLNREGSYEARGEGITAQHMMNALSITDTYKNQTKSAELSAKAAWRPLTSGFLMETLGLTSGTISGAASGAQMGFMTGTMLGGAGSGSGSGGYTSSLNSFMPNGGKPI